MGAIQQILLSYPGFVGVLDAYATGLGGAYSVARRLLSSYTSPLIRVRRDSDGTEADIGYDAEGLLDEVALLAFVGAGSGYLVTIYDQSGLGRHVTCSTSADQIRVVNAGVVEVVGTQSRPCGYAVSANQGPYVSATFTANASATISAVSSFYFSPTPQASGSRYFGATLNNGNDYDSPNAFIIFQGQDANNRLRSYSNFTNLATIDNSFGQTSILARLTGSNSILNNGVVSNSVAFSTTAGFNRVIIGGYSASSGYCGQNDRHMEHVVWQTDIGATAAAAIRAEQEAFYA